jgi:hypothetical protein
MDVPADLDLLVCPYHKGIYTEERVKTVFVTYATSLKKCDKKPYME